MCCEGGRGWVGVGTEGVPGGSGAWEGVGGSCGRWALGGPGCSLQLAGSSLPSTQSLSRSQTQTRGMQRLVMEHWNWLGAQVTSAVVGGGQNEDLPLCLPPQFQSPSSPSPAPPLPASCEHFCGRKGQCICLWCCVLLGLHISLLSTMILGANQTPKTRYAALCQRSWGAAGPLGAAGGSFQGELCFPTTAGGRGGTHGSPSRPPRLRSCPARCSGRCRGYSGWCWCT